MLNRTHSIFTAHLRHYALALVAVTSAACVTEEDTVPDEQASSGAVTSALTGDTAYYSCVYPMCGGAGIKFDSRDLHLGGCVYDARAGVLACDPQASDSAQVNIRWEKIAVQLTCVDGSNFTCTTVDSRLSCACNAPTSTAAITYGPIITIKPKG